MYCKNCGSTVTDDAKFCQRCGVRLDSTVNWTYGGVQGNCVPLKKTPPKRKGKLPPWAWTFLFCVLPMWFFISIIPDNQKSQNEIINETQVTAETQSINSYDQGDRILYIYYAHKFVRDQLSSPLTAIFASYGDHEVTGQDNLVCVKGHVNAQNKLGVFIKKNFTVQFTIEDNRYHCTYMKLGNSSTGNYVNIE